MDTDELELVYEGPEVNDGSIPIEYLVDALLGFSSAYSKVSARTLGPDFGHRLRVTGLQQDSIHIVLTVVEWVKQNTAAAGVLAAGASVAGNAVSKLASGAYRVIMDIAKSVNAKKHLAGSPIDAAIEVIEQKIYLVNSKGERFELTKQQLEIIKSGILDADLDRITKPLDNSQVNSFEIRTERKPIARVNKEERQYFIHEEKTAETRQDNVWIEGTLNSFSKDRNRGTFHLLTGKHLSYRYVGQDQQQLLNGFGHKGLVRVGGKVSFNSELEPQHIDINTIQLSQCQLFPGDRKEAESEPRTSEQSDGAARRRPS